MPERLQLIHNLAPGDVLVMSGLVRDLALAYPGRYRVSVNTSFAELWQNNPYVVPWDGREKLRSFRLDYGLGIKESGTTPIHFLTAFHSSFKRHTGVYVPLTKPTPDFHLNDKERKEPLVEGRYWVHVTGGKSDFVTKHWSYLAHEQTAAALQSLGIRLVQLGGKDSGHHHPRLPGALDLVGRTTLREAMRIVAGADGVISTITFFMHAAAAMGRPCVVTAGGREEWWWEAYHRNNPGLGPAASQLAVNHQYLHTIGRLDCCAKKGCWRLKVEPEALSKKPGQPHARAARKPCQYPVRDTAGQALPRCMADITPAKVVASVLSYYLDGTLSPEGVMIPSLNDPVVVPIGGKRYAIRLTEETGPPPTALPVTAPRLLIPLGRPTTAEAVPVSIPPATAARATRTTTEIIPILPEKPRPATAGRDSPIHHPHIGGKLTIFSLLYGEFPEMHRRFLSAVSNTTRAGEVDWRVYLNQAGPVPTGMVDQLMSSGRIGMVYRSTENKLKYPCMRTMFHDKAKPITTKWIVWLDDDSYVDIDPDWLDKLCRVIATAQDADPKLGMVGAKMFFPLTPKRAEWVRAGSWYKDLPLQDRSGRPAPNGNNIHFVAGGFWAMRTSCITDCDIPDTRLAHCGGDVLIGSQLYQNGYTLKNWDSDKRIVARSATKRRGFSEPEFGIKG